MGLWVVGGPAGAMLLARGLPNPALLVTNPPAGRDVAEDMADTQSLVGRLASGEVILGDGSYIMTLEKRGYATAGSWTPEAAAEHPEAIEQLGIEFARAGADITQTFTFWAHDDAFPKAANSRAQKSTKQHVTLPRKLPGKEEPLLRAESLRLAHSIWAPRSSPRSRVS